ncbi:hypothetical protein HOV93_17290 [Planctomycetes bacterium FF15]|uniref:Uncharacterized protein n=1 Tax=Bremerella alba TaxID=980252 RepID=A0A7V9A6R7_9BACT|nr:hypothetical protein [Bremerella alba]
MMPNAVWRMYVHQPKKESLVNQGQIDKSQKNIFPVNRNSPDSLTQVQGKNAFIESRATDPVAGTFKKPVTGASRFQETSDRQVTQAQDGKSQR